MIRSASLKPPLVSTGFVAALLVGLTLGMAEASTSAAPLHLALQKSAPAADAVLEEVTEIRLWFTEPPQEGATSIRLLDAGGELVPLGEVTVSPDDATIFSAAVEDPLAAGSYAVSWRAMAADGHVVRGEFGFAIQRSSESALQ